MMFSCLSTDLLLVSPPSASYADDEALTRLLQTSFLFSVALPVLVVFYRPSFLLQVLPDIVHPDSSCDVRVY